jgi:anti-sigma factor ChrR (cupin superfamily)
MTAHRDLTGEVQELASTYALGLLEPDESAEFEQHLTACPVCQSEVRSFRDVAGELAYAAAPVEPPPDLKKRLLRQVAPHSVVVRADESAFQATPFPGVEIRRLFVDKVTGAVTTMLRAAAGAIYPPHQHGGIEHVYVIDGDLIFDDHTLETGDYEVSKSSTHHSAITTKTGCLALIVHHVRDKMFPG